MKLGNIQQYLNWATLEALKLQHPDCSFVTIVYDLVLGICITNYAKKEEETNEEKATDRKG